MKHVGHFIFLCLIFFTGILNANSIETLKIETPIKIDGVLDDEAWQKAKGYGEFRSFHPEFGLKPKAKTVVYTAYDDHFLYFGFKCFDPDPAKVIATMHKRDASCRDDKVGVFIDSHNDGQNGYFLYTNPYGIQADGVVDADLISDMSQDFVWESVGKLDAEGYSVEFKIPFQSLRFSNSKKVVIMRIAFYRNASRFSEQYSFPELFLDKGSLVGQFHAIHLEGIKYKRILQAIPSITYMDHRERNNNDRLVNMGDNHVQLGLTAKVGITSELTLDATVNPDFSHIESDEGQVDVNLRVDALYEEKRPFFLEGLEHFNFAGTGSGTPIEYIFHTRNIINPSLGLKLSGKVGKHGIVNSLFAIDDTSSNQAPIIPQELSPTPKNTYYGVFRYKQLLKKDSYIGGVYTSKEFEGGFLRSGGIDTRIRLNGSLSFSGYGLFSSKKDLNPLDNVIDVSNRTDGWAVGGSLELEKYYHYALLGYHELSKDFNLAPGRLLRNNYRVVSGLYEYYLFVHPNSLKRITLGYDGFLAKDKSFDMNEYDHYFYTRLDFPLSSYIKFGYSLGREIYEGYRFDVDRFAMSGRSQPLKFLYFQFSFDTGGSPYYNMMLQGDLNRLYMSLSLQPTAKFSSEFSLTNHVFKDRETKEKLYDIAIYRNKTTYHLNKYLSLRSILQYNTGIKQLLCDALLEFTYIPGTVIHLGYGPTLEKRQYIDEMDTLRYGDLRIASSTFFFKASYLFRF